MPINVRDGDNNLVSVPVSSDYTGASPFPVNRLDSAVITEPNLTSTGTTSPRIISNYKYQTYSVKVTDIGTSISLMIEASLDNANWFNIDEINTDIYNNGTYGLQRNVNATYLRLRLVTINTGSPIVATKLLLGN